MNAKWIANSKMQNLLEHIYTSSNIEKLELDIKQLSPLFFPPFKKVKDCVIITEKDVVQLENNFNNILQVYMDKTGYEASNTETRINDYFENEISMEAATQMALFVIEIWSLQLKILDPGSTFCFIISSDSQRVELRFHKVRTDEFGWLDNDIESYKDEAMGYVEI